MTATVHYAWEKTYMAVRNLAIGSGVLRERLYDAWWDNLNLLTVHPLPWPDLRKKFEQISERMTQDVLEKGITNQKTSEESLRTLALEILELYDNVCKRQNAL